MSGRFSVFMGRTSADRVSYIRTQHSASGDSSTNDPFTPNLIHYHPHPICVVHVVLLPEQTLSLSFNRRFAHQAGAVHRNFPLASVMEFDWESLSG